jgi:hypothetical protein
VGDLFAELAVYLDLWAFEKTSDMICPGNTKNIFVLTFVDNKEK